jgi:hypothetical protein
LVAVKYILLAFRLLYILGVAVTIAVVVGGVGAVCAEVVGVAAIDLIDIAIIMVDVEADLFGGRVREIFSQFQFALLPAQSFVVTSAVV